MKISITNINLLRYCSALIFIGSGIHHITGAQSYNVLIENDHQITLVFGFILIGVGVFILGLKRVFQEGFLRYLILVSFLILLFDSACSFIKADLVIEQLMERAIKLFTPILLTIELKKESSSETLMFRLKVLTALTFIGHGVFALGLHFVPANFVDMTTSILSLNIDSSYLFLSIVGALDVVLAILLFTKGHSRKIALIYLVGWGLITSMARFAYPIAIGETSADSLIHWGAAMVYRLPHGIVPMMIFYHYYTLKKQLKM